MTFSSSPVVYPPSSSPEIPAHLKKRPAPADEPPQQPKQKKRLFGTNLWNAPNIPVIPAVESKENTEKEPRKDENVKTTPVAEAATPISSLLPHHRAVFIEPPHNPDPQPASVPQQRLTDSDKPSWSFSRLEAPSELFRTRTCSGKQFVLCRRKARELKTYERTIAERSTTEAGRATTSYYGIDIHRLIDDANALNAQRDVEPVAPEPVLPTVENGNGNGKRRNKYAMWTEKYRARKFIDLVGDERTHRSVLRWLKGWDSIVFPGAAKPAVKGWNQEDEKNQRKILLLTGPPGLGKTTLAHVCAKQAGYEVVEINASDERSRDVVKGRIRDCVGTENVRGVNAKVGGSTVRKAGKPVCVVVDEVDGVVSGSGGSGDGGFMKALIDLIQLDQRNEAAGESNGKRKGDRFRLLRPMILICNDVYHPSLRALRSSNLAEIVHVRKPALDKVVARMKGVFEKEGVPADTDAVRRLCEATWGVSRKKDDATVQSAGDGDLRSVLVVGEWAARKLRSARQSQLTRKWVEEHMVASLSSGSSSRGLGRGGTRETAERVFLENAGFSRSATSAVPISGATSGSSVSNAARSNAISLLRSAVETSGELERILSDIFASYPSRPFQDDTFLSKPNAATEWLHFYDSLSSRVYTGQEWELQPYLSAPILGFHHLFGSTNQFSAHHHHGGQTNSHDESELLTPFTGMRADFEASESHRATRATLQSVHSGLSTELFRAFRSPEHLATDLVPYISRLLAPNVSPVIIQSGAQGQGKGTASVRKESEKLMVQRAAGVMCAAGIEFERVRVEDGVRGGVGMGGWAWRMEPPIDELSSFPTASSSTSGGAPISAPAPRFAVRQVLSQEHQRLRAEHAAAARQARFAAGSGSGSGVSQAPGNGSSTAPALTSSVVRAVTASTPALANVLGEGSLKVKRDFFGRPVAPSVGERPGSRGGPAGSKGKGKATIWVTFHEGFSNAVRKPVSLGDVMGML